jgi:quinol monooxygenase YgiN
MMLRVLIKRLLPAVSFPRDSKPWWVKRSFDRGNIMKKLTALVLVVFFCWETSRLVSAHGSVAAEEPLYVVTHVDAMPKFTAAASELLKQFADDSRNDAGAVRIEVLEEVSRPNHSTVVEVWRDRKAYDEHLAADHTRAYRAKLQPMLGSPFDERLHHMIRDAAAR